MKRHVTILTIALIASMVATLNAQTTETLVSAGSLWKYLDPTEDLHSTTNWPDVDDSLWAEGLAPLGFGDGWIVTNLINPAPNPPCHYFRKSFMVGEDLPT